MDPLTIIITVLPLVVRLAEVLFGKQTGPQKFKFVLDTLPSVAATVGGIVTGGARNTWKVINENIDLVTDAIEVTVGIIDPKMLPFEEEKSG